MIILKTETILFDPVQEAQEAKEYKEQTDQDVMVAYTNGAISFTRNQIMHVDLGKE